MSNSSSVVDRMAEMIDSIASIFLLSSTKERVIVSSIIDCREERTAVD